MKCLFKLQYQQILSLYHLIISKSLRNFNTLEINDSLKLVNCVFSYVFLAAYSRRKFPNIFGMEIVLYKFHER